MTDYTRWEIAAGIVLFVPLAGYAALRWLAARARARLTL